MTDVQTQIADALLGHTSSGSEGASLVNCWCGERFDTFAHHAEHAAAAVIGQLGMAPETRTLADGYGGMSTNYKTGVKTVSSKPCTRQIRWTTKWENDPSQVLWAT